MAEKPFSECGETLYLAAMRFEANALMRFVARAKKARNTGFRKAVSGFIRGRPVLIAVSGIGAQAARAAAESCVGLARQGRCRRVVWIGIAGALSPGLRVGDLIVAANVRAPEGRSLDLDRDLVAAAAASGCVAAALVSTPAPVVTADERRRFWRLVGSPGRAAVDMESWEAARVLDAAGLPFAVLRAISDTLEDDLPAALENAVTAAGGISIPRLAMSVLRRPQAAVPLAAVRFRAARCARALGGAAAALA